MILLSLDSKSAAIGECFTGTMGWSSAYNLPPKLATISIGWSATGRGIPQHLRVSSLQFMSDRVAVSQSDPIPFSLSVPWGAPVTYNGKLFGVSWTIKIVVLTKGFSWHSRKRSPEEWVMDIRVIPRNVL
jgi:hypothetical protein